MPSLRPLVAGALAATILAAVCALPADPAAAQTSPVGYTPPVPGPVIDPFRPPSHPYGPGNRGVDYATEPGAPVRAAGSGEVVFAGQVGGELHVVVLHPDGLRTSYSFLASITVRRGQRVERGDVVGTSGPSVHFGVRSGDTYLDPEDLFAGRLRRSRLVPIPPEDEATLVRRLIQGTAGSLARGGAWLGRHGRRGLRLATHYARLADLPGRGFELAGAVLVWWDRRDECTAASVVRSLDPGDLRERVVVLVAGFGSTSGRGAGIDALDTAALGYDPASVVRFSYEGGIVPDPQLAADLAALPASEYGREASQAPIAEAADRLAELLTTIQRIRPGATIDVLAHSQGGVVAVEAVRRLPAQPAGGFHVVTIGSPHAGDTLATGLDLLSTSPLRELVLDGFEAIAPAGLDGLAHDSPAARDLSKASDLMAGYRNRPIPEGVALTSIGGRLDLVVPSPDTRPPAGHHVVVDGPGDPRAVHGALPAAPGVRHEVALAVRGLAPTCEGLIDVLVDTSVGRVVTDAQDAIAVLLR